MLKTVDELSVPKEHPERNILKKALQQRVEGELVGDKVVRLTEEEFNDTIYRWIMMYALRDFEKNTLPLPPKGYEQFKVLKRKRRLEVIKSDELIRAMVLGYRGKVIATEYKNMDNQEWLSKMKTYFREKNEMEKVHQIEQVEESYL